MGFNFSDGRAGGDGPRVANVKKGTYIGTLVEASKPFMIQELQTRKTYDAQGNVSGETKEMGDVWKRKLMFEVKTKVTGQATPYAGQRVAKKVTVGYPPKDYSPDDAEYQLPQAMRKVGSTSANLYKIFNELYNGNIPENVEIEDAYGIDAIIKVEEYQPEGKPDVYSYVASVTGLDSEDTAPTPAPRQTQQERNAQSRKAEAALAVADADDDF